MTIFNTFLVRFSHTQTLTFCSCHFVIFVPAGDSRVNLNLGLALFHNMFLRFHNYVAYHFRSLNDWTDEKLYQETRRFVIATIQHITYTQFLPTILGTNGGPICHWSYLQNSLVIDSLISLLISNTLALLIYAKTHFFLSLFFLLVQLPNSLWHVHSNSDFSIHSK